jgi:hypothetical protein
MLEAFGQRELLEVIDMTEFVTTQRNILSVDAAQLLTPVERVYVPAEPSIAVSPVSGLRSLENALELPIIFSMLRGRALTRVSRRNSGGMAVSRRR